MPWLKNKKREDKKDAPVETQGSLSNEIQVQPSYEDISRDPELRKLSRSELLEILAELSREKDQLQAELDQAKKQLADRTLRLNKAGDLAQAALAMNDIFARAQQAADDYLAAVKANADVLSGIKTSAVADIKTNAKADVKADTKADGEANTKADAGTEVRSETQAEVVKKKEKKDRRVTQKTAKFIEKKLLDNGVLDTAPDVEVKKNKD
ncbi:MAG TPA: hypothetical protein DEP00_00165 [Lachnospiraceae bacterium]|nr:hypothetical protein [Lachnospiraceae bacterium]